MNIKQFKGQKDLFSEDLGHVKTGPSIQIREKIKDDMCELMGIFSWQLHKGVHTMER